MLFCRLVLQRVTANLTKLELLSILIKFAVTPLKILTAKQLFGGIILTILSLFLLFCYLLYRSVIELLVWFAIKAHCLSEINNKTTA